MAPGVWAEATRLSSYSNGWISPTLGFFNPFYCTPPPCTRLGVWATANLGHRVTRAARPVKCTAPVCRYFRSAPRYFFTDCFIGPLTRGHHAARACPGDAGAQLPEAGDAGDKHRAGSARVHNSAAHLFPRQRHQPGAPRAPWPTAHAPSALVFSGRGTSAGGAPRRVGGVAGSKH